MNIACIPRSKLLGMLKRGIFKDTKGGIPMSKRGTAPGPHFIRNIIAEDVQNGKNGGRVHTLSLIHI